MDPVTVAAIISSVGSIAGGLLGRKKSQRSKTERVPIYSPEQMAFQNQMLENSKYGMGQSFDYLNKIMSDDPTAMAAFEAPFKRQFEEQTIPGIAERFAGMNAQGSSAFGQSLSQAGAGLSENLAALRANLKGQAMSQIQQFAGIGLTPQYNVMHQPGESADNSSMGIGIGKAASAWSDWITQPTPKRDHSWVQNQGYLQNERQMQYGNHRQNPWITNGYRGGYGSYGGGYGYGGR